MINIMYAVDPIKRIVKPMSEHVITEQDHEASSLRFAFPDNIPGTGLESTGVAVRVMYIRPDGGDPVAKTLTFYKHSGGYYLYDWNLQKSDLQKEGHLVFSLCILDISGGEVSEWHTTPCAVRVLSTIHTDDSDEGDDTITPTVKERVAVLETMIQRVASGAPIVVASTSAMTDTEQIYVLSTDGKWYYHNGSAWVVGGEYGALSTDRTLSMDGIPADAKAVGDEIADIKERVKAIEDGGSGSGLTDAQKLAILNCFQHVAWTDDKGKTYYDELEDVLFPPAEIRRITAVYSNTKDVYPDTNLDDLRAYITVTAHYSDGTTEIVNAYTLNGTLTIGTSIITVSYSGKSTTINVVVVNKPKSDMTQWSDGITYTDIEVIENSYYASGGAERAYNGWNRTGKIPCDGASKIVFNPNTVSTVESAFCWFFKSDKTSLVSFDKAINRDNITEITVPSDAYFFGLSGASSTLTKQLEQGFTPYA